MMLIQNADGVCRFPDPCTVPLPVAGGVAAAGLVLCVQQDLLHVPVMDGGRRRYVFQPPDDLFHFFDDLGQAGRSRGGGGLRCGGCVHVQLELHP